MRPKKAPELPLHNGSAARGSNVARLNNAFEKGLDMAGLTKTKTGPGDKRRAYIVAQNTALKVILAMILFGSIGIVLLFSTYLKVNIVRRDAVHAEAHHRSISHATQLKLLGVHLQLQKSLDATVHESTNVEEYRSFAEKVLGDTSQQVKDRLVKVEGIDKAALDEVEGLLTAQSDKLLAHLNTLIHTFSKRTAEARESLKQLSSSITEDIEVDDKQKEEFKARMKELGESEDFDYKAEVADDFEDVPEPYIDTARIEKEVEHFYHKLRSYEFPLIDSKIVEQWETKLNTFIESLEDEEKETDLEKLKTWFNGELLTHAPKTKPYDESLETTSIIDFVEEKVYEAKIGPHRQNLLDMYTGWKDGKLTVTQVLANLEKVANDENLYLIYDWLNGELDHTYYHDGEVVSKKTM